MPSIHCLDDLGLGLGTVGAVFTGSIAKSSDLTVPEPLSAYVEKINDEYFVGVGVYKSFEDE